jgi:hypothetical protein
VTLAPELGEATSAAGPADPTSYPHAPRRLLGILISRALAAVTRAVDQLGRLFFYVGLLLVALTDWRLPGDVAGIADPFLFVSLICAVFLTIRGQSFNIAVFKFHTLGVALLAAGMVISILWQPREGLQNLISFGKLMFVTTLLIFTCVVIIKHRRQLILALGCWVTSAVVTSIVAVLHTLYGESLFGIDSPGKMRMGGLTGNPNHLGYTAGLAIVGAASLAARASGLGRVPWLFAIVGCVSGVMVSVSRTGATVALGSLAVWFALHFRLKREATLLLGAVAVLTCLCAGYLFVTAAGGLSLADRMTNMADPSADLAIKGRLDQYGLVIDLVMQQPFVGVGFGDDSLDGDVVHNMVLRVVYAGGLLSGFGLILILGDLLFKGVTNYGNAGSYEMKVVALCLLAGVIGLILGGMTEPVLYQRQVWIPAALTMALWVLQRRSYEGRPSTSTAHRMRGRRRSLHRPRAAHDRLATR